MKTFSKVLSMFLVVVMCFGLFATSAYADGFDFGQDTGAGVVMGGGFEGSETYNNAPAADDGFSLNSDEPTANAAPAAEVPVVPQAAEEQAETSETVNNEGEKFNFGDSDTFDKPYEEMSKTEKEGVEKLDEYVVTNKDGTIVMSGVQFDTFKSYKVAAGTNFEDAVTVPNEYLKREGDTTSGTVTIKDTWVKMQSPGYYTVWGIKISDGTPIKIGSFQINEGEYNVSMVADEYIKPNAYSTSGIGGVSGKAKAGDMKLMEGFGVASLDGTYTRVLSSNDYRVDGNIVTLAESYLRNLSNGQYWLIGFPSNSNKGNQVRFGKFTIRSLEETGTGTWTLSPDYQVWYSGTDPLTFYSNVFEAAGEGWNYKGYKWDVIVPDIRVSTRSDMSGATSVRIDQYWDLGYGYFMLGQNFLSSLSADETYYMQVIDARSPDLIRTNVVTFRVGPTLRAIDTDKHVINSTRSLRFRSSSPVAEVYVGNIMLTDPADYGVSWDGKTVTLSFEFLNKRSAGNTYTIKVQTDGGYYCSSTFQILTTAQGGASPRTGDESNLGLWAAFLLISGSAVVVLIPKLRKHGM